MQVVPRYPCTFGSTDALPVFVAGSCQSPLKRTLKDRGRAPTPEWQIPGFAAGAAPFVAHGERSVAVSLPAHQRALQLARSATARAGRFSWAGPAFARI